MNLKKKKVKRGLVIITLLFLLGLIAFFSVRTIITGNAIISTMKADFKATNPNEVFSFIVYGDSHQEAVPQSFNNQKIYPKIVTQINKLKPEFIVNLGDVVASGMKAEDWAVFHNASLPLEVNPAPEGLPVFQFPTIGGHEYCCTILAKCNSLACTNLRNEFPFLKNLSNRVRETQNYYAFIYGNSYFIIVNTYLPLYNTEGLLTSSTQYGWLSKVAGESKSYPNTFIFAHDGPYYATQKLCGTPYRPLKEVSNLVYSSGRNVVYFAGHEDNTYGYFDCEAGDGGCRKATYFVTAGAGGETYQGVACSLEKYDYDVRPRVVRKLFHFMRIGVSGKNLRVTVFNENGGIIDNYFIINQQYVGTNVNVEISRSLSCNFNSICEANLYENEENCPGDCLQSTIPITSPTCTSSDWECTLCSSGEQVCVKKTNCTGGFTPNYLTSCPTTSPTTQNTPTETFTFDIGDTSELYSYDYPTSQETITVTDTNTDSTNTTYSTNTTSSDYCNTNWSCSSWTACSNGIKTRNCYDLEFCNDETDKPLEELNCTDQICTPNWTCSEWHPSNCSLEMEYRERLCEDSNNCNSNLDKPQEKTICPKPSGELEGFNWGVLIFVTVVILILIGSGIAAYYLLKPEKNPQPNNPKGFRFVPGTNSPQGQGFKKI